jgi:glutamate-1-semialdehyde 2,1-aminomutase
MNRKKSKALYEKAVKVIPGGVNSPVRAFKSVGLDPLFVSSANGSKITDVDGNEYIDYIGSWGPMILGHASNIATDGIMACFENSTSFGVATEKEIDMANLICEAHPSIEKVRMVSSGTEATMSALRVARGYTGRDKILKFEGCYHGHSDSLLVKSGSGTLTFGVPTSPGVPKDVVKHTIVGSYNDIDNLNAVFSANKNEIAAVILEPVAGNMGVVAPNIDFLKALRKITKEQDTVLIFDEVITGFRLAYGGAEKYFGITPDMTCLGKIIGGGLPVGAYGGKKEIMDTVAPIGGVYQAGTLSGNPLAMTMGYNVVSYLKENPAVYAHIEKMATMLEDGFNENIIKTGAKATVTRIGGMVCLFFTDKAVNTYADVMTCDTEAYASYFVCMLDAGILLPPAQFEGIFLSFAHSEADIKKTIEANLNALQEI